MRDSSRGFGGNEDRSCFAGTGSAQAAILVLGLFAAVARDPATFAVGAMSGIAVVGPVVAQAHVDQTADRLGDHFLDQGFTHLGEHVLRVHRAVRFNRQVLDTHRRVFPESVDASESNTTGLTIAKQNAHSFFLLLKRSGFWDFWGLFETPASSYSIHIFMLLSSMFLTKALKSIV